MLIENTLSYNEHGKTEAAAALRLISTQVPALKSALEVMVEQCATRYVQHSCNMPSPAMISVSLIAPYRRVVERGREGGQAREEGGRG